MHSLADPRSTAQELQVEIHDHFAAGYVAAADLAGLGVELIEVNRLLTLEGLSDGEPPSPEHLAALLDPLLESVVPESGAGYHLDVQPRPGVTDSEGEYAALALQLAGLPVAAPRCRSGLRYRFRTDVPAEIRGTVAHQLGNPLIHTFRWWDESVVHSEPETASARVHRLELDGLDGEQLRTTSRNLGLALNLDEMQAVAAHFSAVGRAPTDVEVQSLAQTWSEHCSHKTFKATIDFLHDGHEEQIDGLLRTCIVEPSLSLSRQWVRSAFADNAGMIAFDGRYDLAFKVETHNHPSALEPFGGAHTGVGGVIRDVLGVSAEPIANTDVLCFGPTDLPAHLVPPGCNHPATTFREVVRGIADYGNNMGIPTVGGAVLFHPGYTTNPLVFCGTLGILPRGSHPTAPLAGDLVVVLGGGTGRDGLHGATMSSSPLDPRATEGSVVQIGNPITEKIIRDILPRLRDERLYHAITDCGAGGLCSAVGEMGQELGVEVELAEVPLKYPGLAPWEIWLSEAQERMVLAVPDAAFPRLDELCRGADVPVAAIGRFRDDGRLLVRFQDDVVADLEMDFLHGGRPPRVLQARWDSPPVPASSPRSTIHPESALLGLLNHPNVASKEQVIRQYDHEVGAATVIKPLVGYGGPSDAAVLKPLADSWTGAVVAHGVNPLYQSDPYTAAVLTVDEALRNLVAVGGDLDHAALLDNFCWGDVDDPRELGALVRAAQGCRDAVQAYGVPFISGKDSLYNSSALDGSSIPGTLLISAVGVIPDVRLAVTSDLKEAGNLLYMCGLTGEDLGGSLWLWMHGMGEGGVPAARPYESAETMRRLTSATAAGLVRGCHDLSEGGLAVAAAEMAIGGNLGLSIALEHLPLAGLTPPSRDALLFGESPGRFLAEVKVEDAHRFEQVLGSRCSRVGVVALHRDLVITHAGELVLKVGLERLAGAWRRS